MRGGRAARGHAVKQDKVLLSGDTSIRPPRAAASFNGHHVLLARTVWVAAVLTASCLFLAGIPQRIHQIRWHTAGLLGVDISAREAGELVLLPKPGSAVARAGILAGDVLVAVDGHPVAKLSSSHAEAALRNGAIGAPVVVSVRTGNRPPRSYTLVRGGDELQWLAPLGLTPTTVAAFNVTVDSACALVVVVLAALIFWRRPHDVPALLLSAAIVVVFVGVAAPVLALVDRTLIDRRTLDGWFSLVLATFVLFCCLFPDGRWEPGWTRWMMACLSMWMLAAIFVPWLYPWRMPAPLYILTVSGCLTLGMYAQMARYGATMDINQRQQTRSVVVCGVLAALGVLLDIGYRAWLQQDAWLRQSTLISVVHDLGVYPISQLLRVALPIAIAIAIVRYHLFDIDLIVNRALIYAILSAAVIGGYVVVVGGLGLVFHGQGNLLITLVATGVVAVVFQPLRMVVQRAVNRMLYGERDEPYGVIARLSSRLEASVAAADVIPTVVETVAQALKLPYVAISLRMQGERVPTQESIEPTMSTDLAQFVVAAAYGRRDGLLARDLLVLPLAYRGDIVGELLLAPRGRGAPFTTRDLHLLNELARQAGLAAHAVMLVTALERSRLRIVAAREEARRRLGGDLHDGMGHRLAGLLRKVETVSNVLAHDHTAAETHLRELTHQLKLAIQEVRHLAHTLHPPELDLLGLVEALRERAANMTLSANGRVVVEADVPPGLPAAVETAAYYIVLEALTNVQRHAAARNCWIRLAAASQPPAVSGSLLASTRQVLAIHVCDDGRGLGDNAARATGLGLASMHERAAELGGTCTIEPRPEGGTCVTACLPLFNEPALLEATSRT